jgi:hypothetical protein
MTRNKEESGKAYPHARPHLEDEDQDEERRARTKSEWEKRGRSVYSASHEINQQLERTIPSEMRVEKEEEKERERDKNKRYPRHPHERTRTAGYNVSMMVWEREKKMLRRAQGGVQSKERGVETTEEK